MAQLFESILQISLSMAAVIGVLLLLVPLWQKRYSAKWRKAIWLIIAVRLLIPFSLELPQAPVQVNVDLQAAPMWQSAVTDDAVMDEMNAAAIDTAMQTASNDTANNAVVSDVTVAKEMQLSRGQLWALVWLVGMIVFLLVHGSQYVIFRRRVLESAQRLPEQERLLQQAGEGLNLHRYPIVLLSRRAQGAMLIGFLKSAIILPERIYGERELTLILRHELVHYQQHDLWYKLLLLLTNAVHWFNPFVYLMNRQANRDVEQVCDDKVVANQDMNYRKAYSMTILDAMSSSRGIALSTYLSKEAQNSKRRFTEILYPQKYGRGLMMLCVVVLLAVAASGCLQVGEKAAEVMDEQALQKMGVDLYAQVAPWLPEGAIKNPEKYTVQASESNSGAAQRCYRWEDSPVEVPEEANGILYREYGEADTKLYPSPHILEIWMDAATKEITGIDYFAYYHDKDGRIYVESDVIEAQFFETEESRRQYLDQFVKAFIPDGEKLTFQYDSVYPQNSVYIAMDENTHIEYRIELSPVTGCVTSYRTKFFHLAWQNELENWLMDQYRKNLGDSFAFPLDIEAKEYHHQIKKDGQYILFTGDWFFWKPKLTEQMEQKLEALRQVDAAQYDTVYRNYQGNYKEYPNIYTVADIQWNDKLKLSTAQVSYYDAESGALQPWDAEHWQQKENQMQIKWTAASYASAYCARRRETMALFGVADEIAFTNQTYRNAYPSVLLEQCSILTDYVDGTKPVQVRMVLPINYGTEYLYFDMTLEKVDGEWLVTNAVLDDTVQDFYSVYGVK